VDIGGDSGAADAPRHGVQNLRLLAGHDCELDGRIDGVEERDVRLRVLQVEFEFEFDFEVEFITFPVG